jgi:hypothetical protein
MAEPKSPFEVLQNAVGGALGAVAGYHVARLYNSKDPQAVALLSGLVTSMVMDAAKTAMAEGKKIVGPSEAQKMLEEMMRTNRQFSENLKRLGN